uniref:HP domain-containing protein n=1 Tax=Musca domestica TaxID=7370 RepID=A0A1I8MP32_MUSDO
MQVIRSQTVQTTSSRWSSPSSSATASPSPTSALLQQTLNSSAVRDIHSQSSQKQKQHKNHNTNSTSSASATNTTTKSPFRATNGFLQQHQQQKTKTNQSTTTKFQPSREIGTKTTRTTTTTTTNTTKSKSSTSSSSAKPLASPLNGKRNWPQIVVENMSSTLDICDNDDDNEHVHDNDYIVEDASGDDDDDVDEEEHHDVNGGHRENHHHFHSPQNITLVDHDDDEDDYHHRFNGETLDDEDDRFFAKPQHPNNTSSTTTGFSAFKSLGLNANNATTTLHDDDHDSHVNGNADNDDYHPHHHQHHQQQQHPRYELQNGHSSSSCSSLNSHNGNSCTNGNQLFLLDTAPSLKLSNLMKSSSSISNSSNNSTTAMQNETTTTTTTTTTTNFNSNLNKNSNSSMNTHKSMAGKNISLHAIVGNNNNHHHPSIGDRTTKTTASLTPSPTTTTTRPSWQQPTIFRQNGNNTPPHSPLTSQRGSRGQTAQHSTSSTPSSSHSSKSRVGDNNCCGSSGSGSGSSDESRPHTTAELRHQQPQPQHQSQRQREQSLPSSQHEQRQSPPSALYQLKPQNDRLTPTQSVQLRPQQHSYNRVDLESFRHYGSSNNNNNIITSHHITSDTYANDSAPALSTDHQHHHHHSHHNDDDGDGLRLSSRHLRRQQIPRDSDYSAAPSSLHRSRSISTDDLSTDWDINGVDNEEPAEWRRVSKLRRSFQNSGSTKIETTIPPPRRPLDLPESSVSVSKIRAELENGRRLNTVMKNNHVDLAALSSILNGPDNKPVSPSLSSTRSSFLTAESLKEIRGKLKRLSDESLYKEDFIISQQTNAELPEQEHIEVQPSTIRKSVEKSPERYTSRSTERREEEPAGKHNTNSLESRLKFKETNPTEWHLRRKSYGFEKMSPPDKTSMQRMDASTDSGLGRSGELQNWSPTTQDSNRTVVVRLGENSGTPRSSITGLTSSSSVHRRFRQQKSYDESENSPEEEMAPNKRHSIAVDDRDQYVRDNGRQTTQVRLNGFYERNSPLGEGKFVQTSEMLTTSSGGFSQKVQQKRVEFCKTEVHFATESGRVNIVETDSKPPPTNNFRRRRSRSSSVGPLQSLVKSATTVSTTSTASSSSVAMPVTLFGDDKLRRKTIASTTVAYRAPLVDSPEPDKQIAATPAIKNVTVTTVAESYGNSESSRSSYASTSGVDTTDYETDEMTSLRGILKNKPAKPKPYVLGENIDKPDELWGVQSIKSMKGPGETRGPNDSPLTIPAPQNMASIKSVAERIQDLSQTNGFSTKINLNVGNGSSPVTVPSAKNWEENGQQPRPQRRLSAQEMLLQDLKDHQRILDEGLKSTTLIIKTMRSATEFDEAMRRLSIASIEAQAATQPKIMLRSNSYQESSSTQEFQDPLQNTEPSNMHLYKSTSFSSNSSWSTNDSRKFSLDSRKTSTDSGASFVRHGSGPRLSFLGNEQIPVSQQLQRLRLIYDAATISPSQNGEEDEEDSADEEVKSYFRGHVDSDSGGGTQESSSYEDDFALEHSHSWSRLKAKKTIWKIDTDNSTEVASGKTLEKTDLPNSNVMSIKLHSPQATTEIPTAVKPLAPVAKPRTVSSNAETKPTTATTTTQPHKPYQTSLPTKDSLKIIKEARGARQLRDHELSYFGIAASKVEQEKLKTKYPMISSSRNSPKRSLPLRRVSEEMAGTNGRHDKENGRSSPHNKWQLDHDKPDLLKHNPPMRGEDGTAMPIKPAERTSLKKKAALDEEEEHLYENIANDITPVFKVKEVYDRKLDLQRDAMILSEMNESADQTLRELSDEASLKDRKRRSLPRRNSKPLETIDEKAMTEKISDTCIAVKVSRGTFASEAKKTSRHNTPSPNRLNSAPRERTSSQSSVECCPRARSRSLSSEKEYENLKTSSKSSRSTQMVKHKSHKPQTERRSSSLDSQRSYHSQYSSGEEQQQQQQLRNSFRREDRSRAKTKRPTNTSSSSSKSQRCEEKTSSKLSSSAHHSEFKRSSSTTRSSTHRERAECHKGDTNGHTDSQHNKRERDRDRDHHHSGTSSLQRGSAISSSGRRHRDELRDSQRLKRSTATSDKSSAARHEKAEGSGKHSSSRLARDDERNNSTRSSSHRLERSSGDKEKEKLSKSKAHSSRSTSQQRHERSATTITTTTTSSHTTTAPSSSNDPDRHHSRSGSKTKAVTSTENTTQSKNSQQRQQQQQQQHHHHRPNHSSSASSSKERSREHAKDPTLVSERKQKSAKTPTEVITKTHEHVYGLKSAIIKTTTKLREKSRARKEKK